MGIVPSLVWWLFHPPSGSWDPSVSSGTQMFGQELGSRVGDPQLASIVSSLWYLQSHSVAKHPVSGPQFPCILLGVGVGVGLADGRDLWQRWEENLEQPLPLLPELCQAADCELALRPCVLSPPWGWAVSKVLSGALGRVRW